MKDTNYEEDIRIDQDALDLEWLDQANRKFKYSKILADCRRELESAESNLAVTKAEVSQMIRRDPKQYGLEKTTEGSIAEVLLLAPEVQTAIERVNTAKYEVDIAFAAVNSFEHRKAALENLVKLFGQNYFAGPSVPNNINRDWEHKEKQKSSDAATAEAMKNRKLRRRE
jgi:hypothetical protein